MDAKAAAESEKRVVAEVRSAGSAAVTTAPSETGAPGLETGCFSSLTPNWCSSCVQAAVEAKRAEAAKKRETVERQKKEAEVRVQLF